MTSLPPPQPQRSEMGYIAGQATSRAAAGASAYAGIKAGQNHYHLNGDVAEAAWRGAIAGRRWMVWTFGCLAWGVMVLVTFCMLMGIGVSHADYLETQASGFREAEMLADYQESKGIFFAWFLSLPIVLIFLLVIYKRNIDFGLHQRKSIYYFAKKFSPLFAWAPNFLLYAGFLIVPWILQLIFV